MKPQTTLAREYARRHAASYPAGVAFVSADAASELELLQRIAVALRLYELASNETEVDKLRDELHAWLRQNVGWLLIIDNADDAEALSGALQRSLPASDALGHVLLTSRVGTEAFGALGIDAPLTLGVLAPEDATRLLVREAGKGREGLSSLDDAERCAADWLAGADALAGLPLALLQAGKMVKERKLSFARYREKFENRHLEIFEAAPSGTERPEQSVRTTWLLNLEALEEAVPAAAELLSLCSLLAPDGIPAPMLFALLAQGEEGEERIDLARATKVCPELVKALSGLDVDERQDKIEKLLGAAQRYSLLDFDAADAAAGEDNAWRSVSMHRLVQDAQRRRAKSATEAVALLSQLLVAAMPGIEFHMACTGEAMERFRRLRSHVLALWNEARRLGAVGEEVVALLGEAIRALNSNGEYAEVEAMQREVLAVQREVLGARHLDTLVTLNNLALTVAELGKPTVAEAMQREVLTVLLEEEGPPDPLTLMAMSNLAGTLGMLGKHLKSGEMELEVLAAQRKMLGARHPDTLLTMGNLAMTFEHLGKHVKAEAMLRDVLVAQRAVLGPREQHTLVTMQNLAGTLRALGNLARYDAKTLGELGKHAEAEARFREALSKNAEAEAMGRELLAARRDLLGDRHPDTLKAMHNLAETLRALGNLVEAKTPRALGNLAEAETMLQEVLAARRAVLGVHHPSTIDTMYHLQATLRHLGKHVEADAMLQQLHDCANPNLDRERDREGQRQ